MKIAMMNRMASFVDVINVIENASVEQLKSLQVCVYSDVSIVGMEHCEITFNSDEWESILRISPLLKMMRDMSCELTIEEIVTMSTCGRYSDPDDIWKKKIESRVENWKESRLITCVIDFDNGRVFYCSPQCECFEEG